MLDALIWRFCERKNEQWDRADYSPPVWWTYVTQPVGWFVMRQGRRIERRRERVFPRPILRVVK